MWTQFNSAHSDEVEVRVRIPSWLREGLVEATVASPPLDLGTGLLREHRARDMLRLA